MARLGGITSATIASAIGRVGVAVTLGVGGTGTSPVITGTLTVGEGSTNTGATRGASVTTGILLREGGIDTGGVESVNSVGNWDGGGTGVCGSIGVGVRHTPLVDDGGF